MTEFLDLNLSSPALLVIVSHIFVAIKKYACALEQKKLQFGIRYKFSMRFEG